jgi:hypothetical protein
MKLPVGIGEISFFNRIDHLSSRRQGVLAMRLSWPQHLETARLVERAADEHRGMALGLMGVALLLLAQDLLDDELTGPTT